ncbi:hypothetical protein BS78_06G261100 [Paspalum vaginatum]|nr:hypothetical protein BS78_06G261100 [Paspalum vaginatum]
MAPPFAKKIRSLGQVQELVALHGDVEGVVVHLFKRIESLSQGKEMAVLLLPKTKKKNWDVPAIDLLKKLIPIHRSLTTADSLVDDAIRRTNPAILFARPAGYHVGPSVRLALLNSASSRRRNDRASPRRDSSGRRAVPASDSSARRATAPLLVVILSLTA